MIHEHFSLFFNTHVINIILVKSQTHYNQEQTIFKASNPTVRLHWAEELQVTNMDSVFMQRTSIKYYSLSFLIKARQVIIIITNMMITAENKKVCSQPKAYGC